MQLLSAARPGARLHPHASASSIAVALSQWSVCSPVTAHVHSAVAAIGPLAVRHWSAATSARCFHSCLPRQSTASADPPTPTSAPSLAAAALSEAAAAGLAGLPPALASLARGVLDGDRVALSRAITLIESIHPNHVLQAQQLLAALTHERQQKEATQTSSAAAEAAKSAAPASATPEAAAEEVTIKQKRALRIGISGPPGVGKSTFIEAMGRFLLSHGHRLAVLSIDPSSHVTGGSILGDKTRMGELARHKDAYVRPTPSKCVLGGVAAATYDTVLLCEHAGFNLVLVETVGVGQSEVSVHSMVDFLILLVQPGGGDELQGMKKGLVELIDLVVVNKADGELLAAARHTKMDYAHALQLNTRRKKDTDWKPTVKMCSSIHETGGKHNASQHATPREGTGASSGPSSPAVASRQQQQLRAIWLAVCSFDAWARSPVGDFHLRRAKQADALLKQALCDNVNSRLLHALRALPEYQQVQAQLEAQAHAQQEASGSALTPAQPPAGSEVIPRVAAQKIVDEWINREANSARSELQAK